MQRRSTERSRRSTNGQRVLQHEITELILERGLHAGDLIPSENELVEQLDVSRNSLREALKVLQALGVVEVRHGLGTFVGMGSLEALADGLAFRGRLSLRGDRTELRELIEVREALEVGLISHVVALTEPAALRALEARVVELERVAGTGAEGDAADRAFHEQLYAPLGNQLLSQLLAAFWDVYHDLSQELGTEELDNAEIARSHRAIYAAVADRQPARATAAVVAHFDGIRKRLAALDATP